MDTWRDDANCLNALVEDVDFFSDLPSEKTDAKELCEQCPVRMNCLKEALDTSTIYGIWGGRDEEDIRRALSVNELGEIQDWGRILWCPNCSSQDLTVTNKRRVRVRVSCHGCGLVWNRFRIVRPRIKKVPADNIEVE